MFNLINYLPFKGSQKKSDLSENKLVEYSVKKYGKTYKLLEEYDKKALRDPQELAESGRLQPYLRDIRDSIRARRTNPTV